MPFRRDASTPIHARREITHFSPHSADDLFQYRMLMIGGAAPRQELLPLARAARLIFIDCIFFINVASARCYDDGRDFIDVRAA